MKKIILISLVFCIFSTFIFAETLSWNWVVGVEGYIQSWEERVVIDAEGNSYIAGGFGGQATLGSTSLTSYGKEDVLIAKIDADGNWLWAKNAGGSGFDFAESITIDAEGNSYITGFFMETATFGSTSLTATGDEDIFVAKIDADGNWLWAKKAVTKGSSYTKTIAVDVNGNSYIISNFYGTATFGSISVTATGKDDIFIAKIDADGNWIWAKNAGVTGCENSKKIIIEAYGTCYFSGTFEETANSISPDIEGTGNIFVAKINANGDWFWRKRVVGNDRSNNHCIAIDYNGHFYIAGTFDGTVNFGSTSLTSDAEGDIFVAKMDKYGKWFWAIKSGGTGFNSVQSIAIDANANSYITGNFDKTITFGSTSLTSDGENNLFITKISQGGSWQGATKAGGRYSISGNIVLNGEKGIHIVGLYHNLSTFGRFTLPGYNNEPDIFVAKLDAELNWLGVNWLGAWYREGVDGVAIRANGDVYIKGTFNDETKTFGGKNFFISKLISFSSFSSDNPEYYQSKNIFFKDFVSFDHEYRWSYFEVKEPEKIVPGNKLQISNSSSSPINSIRKFYIDLRSNYQIEAKMQHVKGTTGEGFGLYIQNNDSGFQFVIVQEGLFNVYMIEDAVNKVYETTSWKESSEINYNAPNILKVIKDKDKISFYINDSEVYSANYPDAFNNVVQEAIGFTVGSNQTIEIDYLKISSNQQASIKK